MLSELKRKKIFLDSKKNNIVNFEYSTESMYPMLFDIVLNFFQFEQKKIFFNFNHCSIKAYFLILLIIIYFHFSLSNDIICF